MPTVEETIASIVKARTWENRIALLRLVPQHHGTGEHSAIYAAVAREAYVPHLAPDFAYIHEASFYEREYFEESYAVALAATEGLAQVPTDRLACVLGAVARVFLRFRKITGLAKNEFVFSTSLAGRPLDRKPVSGAKVDAL